MHPPNIQEALTASAEAKQQRVAINSRWQHKSQPGSVYVVDSLPHSATPNPHVLVRSTRTNPNLVSSTIEAMMPLDHFLDEFEPLDAPTGYEWPTSFLSVRDYRTWLTEQVEHLVAQKAAEPTKPGSLARYKQQAEIEALGAVLRLLEGRQASTVGVTPLPLEVQ